MFGECAAGAALKELPQRDTGGTGPGWTPQSPEPPCSGSPSATINVGLSDLLPAKPSSGNNLIRMWMVSWKLPWREGQTESSKRWQPWSSAMPLKGLAQSRSELSQTSTPRTTGQKRSHSYGRSFETWRGSSRGQARRRSQDWQNYVGSLGRSCWPSAEQSGTGGGQGRKPKDVLSSEQTPLGSPNSCQARHLQWCSPEWGPRQMQKSDQSVCATHRLYHQSSPVGLEGHPNGYQGCQKQLSTWTQWHT